VKAALSNLGLLGEAPTDARITSVGRWKESPWTAFDLRGCLKSRQLSKAALAHARKVCPKAHAGSLAPSRGACRAPGLAHRSARARATSAQCRGLPWAGGGGGGSSCRSDEKRNFLRSDPDLAATCRCGWGATVPVKNLWVSRRGFRPLAGDGTSIVLLPPLNLQPTVTSGPVIPPLQKVLHHLFQYAFQRTGARYPCESPGKLRIIKHLQLNRGAAHYKCEIPASRRR